MDGKTHVVAIRILHEGQCVVGDFLYQLNPLLIGGMVNATLQDTATMAVRGDFHTICGNGIVNELNDNFK